MAPKLEDAQQRYLIETDTSTNYFVEAGAGSGKTTELVERMLTMVEKGVNGQTIDISQICAITFTKAAANEFYERFQKKLSQSNSPQAKEALKNIDLCFMGTIDSFCNMVISEHPTEAKVPANAKVIDDKEMEKIWLSKLADIANGLYGHKIQSKYNIFEKYVSNCEQYYIAGLKFLSSTKNIKLNYNIPSNQSFHQMFGDKISCIITALRELVGKDIIVDSSSKTTQQAINYAKIILKQANNFEENLQMLVKCLKKLCGKNGLRFPAKTNLDAYEGLSVYTKKLFVQSQTPTGKPSHWIIPSVDENNNPFFVKDFDNYIFDIAMDFIYDSSKIISDELKRAGKLSFSDYLFYLKEMLEADAKNKGQLINHIYNRHKYFLIDEFQDTDPLQAQIFFYLTASNLDSINSWKDCIPHPGSLFIVGDPKQSIYRFRNADVSSYLNVKNMFNNPSVGKVLNLTNNFRSTKPVCSWFNSTFKVLLKNKDGIQSEYTEIPMNIKKEYKASFGGAYKQTYIGGSLLSSPATSNLATIIKQLVNNNKFTVGDKCEPINYKDIMVIAYKKAQLKYYMNALRENNIPYWVEGNVLFDDCPTLLALFIIFKLINNIQDKKSIQQYQIIFGEPINVDAIMQYKYLLNKLSFTSLFLHIVDDQKLIANFGTKNLEYLYYAAELLRSAQCNGEVVVFSQAVDFIENLINSNNDYERCLKFVDDTNSVHLANLHKVKGLEAPVVIMTEAKDKAHSPQNHVNYVLDPPSSCIFELAGNGFGNKLINWNFYKEQALEQEILDAEKLRLLYVAATRAKSAFIATDFKTKSKSNNGVSSTNQMLPLLEHISEEIPLGLKTTQDGQLIMAPDSNFQNEKRFIEYNEANDTYSMHNNIYTNNKTCKEKTYSIKLPSKLDKFDDKVLDTELKITSKKKNGFDSALAGTLVHKLMELIVKSKNINVNHQDIIDWIGREYKIADTIYVDILNKAEKEIRPFLLSIKSAKKVLCEVPFCFKENQSIIVNGVIDLIYKDSFDNWHIIDYKTNANSNNLSDKYKLQLNQYKSALEKITGINASVSIHHIDCVI